MSPGSWHGQFRVECSDDAMVGLTSAVAAYFPIWQSTRVTNAEAIVRYMLADDPDRNGKHISEGLLHLIVSPIAVSYEIHHANRVVLITSIGFFPV